MNQVAAADAAKGVLAFGNDAEPPGGSPLTDEELTSAWSRAGDAHSGEVVLESPQPVTFDRVVLQKDITHGQRVQSFAVDVWDGTTWKTAVRAGTIGYKRIEYLSAPVTASKVRLRVLGSRADLHAAKLGPPQGILTRSARCRSGRPGIGLDTSTP
ncbi:discoidin domain-containing protein [Streptomyces sp. JV185]|uniref:discoidin domain-containing protein n=1 Tax=Streptomyces sp. JV185 TaxID=858638 RepID=UPI002E768569|nr:discoidin domain-containing protein [Streptomyces sp. JV185]MEE1768727.1 discoidin domain-containing protein [Streptomyces sp. JV185]